MKLYVFLLFFSSLFSQAPPTIPPSVRDKNCIVTTSTSENKKAENTYLKNDRAGINGSYHLSEISTSTEQANNYTMVLFKAPLKMLNTISKRGDLLSSNTTCEAISKALSKMKCCPSFLNHTSGNLQLLPFASVGNFFLYHVNFY